MPNSHTKTLVVNCLPNNLAKSEEDHLKKGYVYAYQCLFSHFKYKTDFLSEEFTTPKLSLVLNDLAQVCKVKNTSINITNVSILSNHYAYETVYSNTKILGLWHAHEVQEEILLGILGPEAWLEKLPKKQVISVKFQLQSRVDVWVFERDITQTLSNWQVSNINGILLDT